MGFSDTPLFAFEVATSRGNIRVVGPVLEAAELDAKVDRVCRVLRLIAVDPDEAPDPRTADQMPEPDPETGRVFCGACRFGVLPQNWPNHLLGAQHYRNASHTAALVR